MKVIDNFLNFPESTRTQESEFICGPCDQNTELDRDKSEQDDMTWWKRIRQLDAKLKLNQEHNLNQQYGIDLDTNSTKLIWNLNLQRLKSL
jgi:hypothetical protein